MIRNVTRKVRAVSARERFEKLVDRKFPPTFPVPVKKGNVTVKIYQVQNREKKRYIVSHIAPAVGRVLKMFSDFELAKREAAIIADRLAAGDAAALKLTGEDKYAYTEAQRAVEHTGIPLPSAAREFARAFDVLGHAGIVEAARYYKKHVETGLPDVPVVNAVNKFAEAKKAEGMSDLYLKDIRGYLGRFADHFRCNIATIQPEDLRAYLGAMKVGPVAKNNHRRLIVALFNFGKAEGWLHADQKTAAERLGAYKVKERDVEIFTPAEMAKLLSHADEDFVPWLVLIGFGGIRNEELRRGLIWEAINFDRGYLIVPAGIAKTGRRRKIDVAENALDWLAPYRDRSGPIFNRDFRKPLARACKAAGVTYKRNALRHSFGAYRMEILRNAGHVSLEMGNSAAVVMKHYFSIVEARAAREYWNIRPAKRGSNIVAMVAR